MAYWKSQFTRFKITKVINFSPGCGMLERACLEKGIPCHSVFRNQTHANWVANVLDQAVIFSLATKGSGVYDAELQPRVDRLMSDVIALLRGQDNDANNSMLALDEETSP